MKDDTKQYEEQISSSLLFQLEPGTSRYIAERMRLISDLFSYLVSINSEVYRDLGEEIFNTANACIQSFQPEKGEFLHYFNKAMEKSRKKALAVKMQETMRGGIAISKKEQDDLRDLMRYEKSMGKDVPHDEFCKLFAEMKGKDEQYVRQLMTLKTNVTVVSEFVTDDEGKEKRIIDSVASYDNEFNKMERLETVKESFALVDRVLARRQERQKPLLRKVLTSVTALKVPKKWVSLYEKSDFFDREIYERCLQQNAPVSRKEIAAELGVSEQSLSRTYKEFEKSLNEAKKEQD